VLNTLFQSNGLIVALIAIPIILWELFIKDPHSLSRSAIINRSVIRSVCFFLMALLFALGILLYRGTGDSILFLTGFVLEYSLSIDNLFIFILIMKTFDIRGIKSSYILSYGIVVTLLLRWIFIYSGSLMVTKFSWIILIFGAILIYSAIKLMLHVSCCSSKTENNIKDNIVTQIISRFITIDRSYQGNKMFYIRDKKLIGTKMFLAMVMVICSDIVCAFDSIPAIFAITTDTFIIYTSNVFATIGLRSLYIALEGIIDRFKYLEYGLVLILLFIGVKIFINTMFHNLIPIWFALCFVIITLVVSIIYSILVSRIKSRNNENLS